MIITHEFRFNTPKLSVQLGHFAMQPAFASSSQVQAPNAGNLT